jgi:hypothetical protein
MSPSQLMSIAVDDEAETVEESGWVINIHPDFIWNTPLAILIK